MSRSNGDLQKTLERKIPRNSSLLLAVSGGKDSVSLLHACVALSRKLKLKLEVAHLDHGLRKDSSRDATFVRKLSKSYGLCFHLKKEKDPPKGKNLEEWGRDCRYKFFGEILVKRNLDYVLTAHNADDVAETFLMRLISNKELRSISVLDERRHVLRPLLSVSRASIEEYVLKYNLDFVEDESNKDLSFLRNQIRHFLIPVLLDNFEPRISEIVSSAASRIDEDDQALNHMASKAIPQGDFGSKDWLKAFKSVSSSVPPALQWRMLEQLLLPILGYRLGRSQSKEAFRVLCGHRLGMEFEGGSSIRRQKGRLLVQKRGSKGMPSL